MGIVNFFFKWVIMLLMITLSKIKNKNVVLCSVKGELIIIFLCIKRQV